MTTTTTNHESPQHNSKQCAFVVSIDLHSPHCQDGVNCPRGSFNLDTQTLELTAASASGSVIGR